MCGGGGGGAEWGGVFWGRALILNSDQIPETSSLSHFGVLRGLSPLDALLHFVIMYEEIKVVCVHPTRRLKCGW